MKRFGEKATREALKNGATLRAWDFYTLQAGYRIIIDGEVAGYITSDLFSKLLNDGTIVKTASAYSYKDYTAAQEAEKTAEEWAAESDRVQAATLAALAGVIAEEQPQAAEAETEEPAAPEYLDESWSESNTAPGICYILEWNTPGSTTHHTRAETVADVQSHVQQIKHQGGRITKAMRFDRSAGTMREFIPETRQEKTDRENRAYCQRIAEELELYATGDAHKCPHCGAVFCFDDWEETEHDSDTCPVYSQYTCPHCGQEVDADDLEQLSIYDYFSDCFDIEYRCGSDRSYRSVSIMVACGGPNIYIDTDEKAVLLYWWSDRARYYLSSAAVEAVDEWAEEYWNL